jgi:hypothetical protein
MSMSCAERCGVTRLIDKRFAGQVRGVGTANIIGRIHIAQHHKIQRSNLFYFVILLTRANSRTISSNYEPKKGGNRPRPRT